MKKQRSIPRIEVDTEGLKEYKDSQDYNAQIQNYKRQRNLDLHIHFFNTCLFRNSVLNNGIRLYNKEPNHIKKSELTSLRLQPVLHSVDEFASYSMHTDFINM